MHAGADPRDPGHPAVSSGLASLVLLRCAGAGGLLLAGITEQEEVQASMPWAVAALLLLAAVNAAVLCLPPQARAGLATSRAVLAADLVLTAALGVWYAAAEAVSAALSAYQDAFSVYLAGTVMLWTFVRGVRVGLRAERQALAAGVRAGRAEAEARILRDAHGGVLPTLAGIRHLALDGGGDRAAIIELVHDCETAIRRRMVDWNGGWGEVRVGIEDEIARLRKHRQIAGEPALLIDVVEVGGPPPLGAAASAALLEAVGEAVRNAGRHAHATRITVSVRTAADWVRVVVRDDGCGFSRRCEGFGVRHSIRRPLAAVGGTAQLRTGAACGSRWEFRVPLAASAPTPLGMTAYGQSAAVAAR